MDTIRVAVIGTGIIGQTLAARFVQAGHIVTMGTRNPQRDDLVELARRAGASLTSIEDAINSSEAVVWAINGSAMADAIPAYGQHLAGKVVIDATNNIGAPSMNSLSLITEHAPSAHAYRAFNSLGWENFANPRYGELNGDLLYTGPAGPAQAVAENLIESTGLRPIRVGDNDKAKIVDDFVALWFSLAIGQGMGRELGFKILTR
ncbi:NADPH-dependent F420 reductase [Arthrobacter sp. MA-N2]|uniref:NADPH-dependent F420 reductase n=1 Tax=Arthrobacter sp. MA-N2 TaxID=1101188 RepID=UPI000480E703|nr:NAD(P)-binding domain-containing protein [Arthrobacter sp. MA-N2]